MLTNLIHKLFILCLILVYSDADLMSESCVPRTCGSSLEIRYPFYSHSLQQPDHCGYPGFKLNCTNNGGFPILHLPENNYVVEDILYNDKLFRVYNAELLYSNFSTCPRLGNTTLPRDNVLDFVDNVTSLHLFVDCSDEVVDQMAAYRVVCESDDVLSRWVLAVMDGGDMEGVETARRNCGRYVVVPVERRRNGDGRSGSVVLLEGLIKGFVLKWKDSLCIGSCETPHNSGGKSTAGKLNLQQILVTCFTALFIVIASTAILLTLLKRKKKKKKKNAYNNKNMEILLKSHEDLAPKRYKYSQLKKITKSFSDNLGKGGYGTVYKGRFHDSRLVAVKLLNESRKNGEDFVNEVASISRTSHINIVTLLGFCFEGSKRALIYEFMPNGSLDKFISAEAHLGWEKLFEIAVGIARGLEYLHRGCNMRILHLDIKPQNILLDKDFHPKIADFGLAKLCPDTASIVSMTGARGTVGYIAPEVCCRNFGEVSHKSDVYSYGMMVLEIVGERRNVDLGVDENKSEAYFPHWVYKHLEVNEDRDGDGVVEEDKKRKLTIVGLWCIQTDPKARPSMRRVVEMLEGEFECLEIPPKPYLSSITRPEVDVSTYESSI